MQDSRQILMYQDPLSGKYIVEVPSLNGASTWGDTREHALAMAQELIAGTIETLADFGDAIPRNFTAELVDVEVTWITVPHHPRLASSR